MNPSSMPSQLHHPSASYDSWPVTSAARLMSPAHTAATACAAAITSTGCGQHLWHLHPQGPSDRLHACPQKVPSICSDADESASNNVSEDTLTHNYVDKMSHTPAVSVDVSEAFRCSTAGGKPFCTPQPHPHDQQRYPSIHVPRGFCSEESTAKEEDLKVMNTEISASCLCDECKYTCGPKRPRQLLGESGDVMHEVEHALSDLLAWGKSDLVHIKEATPWVYYLTPVRFAFLFIGCSDALNFADMLDRTFCCLTTLMLTSFALPYRCCRKSCC